MTDIDDRPDEETPLKSENPPPAEVREDELPDWEPLTPELVEEEAIRGDFMLRWAVVLLAFMFGCTEIAHSETLVHIKTGQYILQHGFLPPPADVFSYTAAERPWVNFSWLFDVLLAGVFAVAGISGVVLFKAALAALMFGLVVHITAPGISTWWGSICAALALLASYQQMTALPAIITLLGLAGVVFCLHWWNETGSPRMLWGLPAIFLVWANLDPRMYLGLAVLLLFAAGDWIGGFVNRGSLQLERRRTQLWAAVAASFAVTVINPFGWRIWGAAVSQYFVEDPALRAYVGSTPGVDALGAFPITMPAFWRLLNLPAVAGLLLSMVAVVVLILNRRRAALVHVLWLGILCAFAAAAVRELPAAALLAAVVATLNAQQWYRSSFRQEFSIETKELIFSRGGRALTVLAFFGLAFLALTGRLSARTRLGLGFSPTLETAIEGLREDVTHAYDDRPFHFTTHQGDVLIWIGRKSFVDSRIRLFAGRGDDNLFTLHHTTRLALRRPHEQLPGTGVRHVWQGTFNRFRLTHAMPRLWGLQPDYQTYVDLTFQPADWRLTWLGGAVAIFHRADFDDAQLREFPKYQQFLEENIYNPTREVFRKPAAAADAQDDSDDQQSPPSDVASLPVRMDWARPPSFYERYLSPPRRGRALPLQKALHAHKHLELAMAQILPMSAGTQAAFAYMAIQHANAALAANPQNAEAYRVLGSVYAALGNLESQVARAAGRNYINSMRFYQSVHGYGQALTIDPTSPETHQRLFETYYSAGKLDLALRELLAYLEYAAEVDMDRLLSLEALAERLRNAIDQVTAETEQQMQNQADSLQIAGFAYNQGCVLRALEILQRDEARLTMEPMTMLLHGRLLLEAGRSAEAGDVLNQLQAIALADGPPDWRFSAAMAALGRADYPSAESLLTARADAMQHQAAAMLMGSAPLAGNPESLRWPLRHLQAAFSTATQFTAEIAESQLFVGICRLESDRPETASEQFRRILESDPNSVLRPLARFYLFQLTGELVDLTAPSEQIPIEPDMFIDESP